MKKVGLLLLLLAFLANVNSQTNNLIGNWVMLKHTIYDTTLSCYKNVFQGQVYRSIQFNSNGTLRYFDNNKEYNGIWSTKGRKFTMTYSGEDFSEGHSFSVNSLYFTSGDMPILERIPILYGEPANNDIYITDIDSFLNRDEIIGDSYYYKDIDTIFDHIDLSQAEACYNLGIEKVIKNPNDTSAITDFKNAIKLRPYSYGLAYLWIVRLSNIDNNNSLQLLNLALNLIPDHVSIHLEIAKRKMGEGKRTEALGNLNWAILLEPDNDSIELIRNTLFNDITKTRKDYGITYLKEEDTLKAAMLYLKAIDYLKTCDNCSKVEPVFEKINKLRPNYYWEAYYWTNNFHNWKKYDPTKAIENLTIAISLSPSNAECYFARSSAKNKLGDYIGAIEDANMAILLNPKVSFYYSYRAKILAEEFDLVNFAIEDLTKAIELNSADGVAYHTRGNYYYYIGNYEKACNDLKIAKETGNYYSGDKAWKKCGL
jgi:tetratricopeptide (TPR) repeat protein